VRGTGLGPDFEIFIFGAEAGEANPLKIEYVFFSPEEPPPESFYDYSKRYELQAVRDTTCDESVNSLSYLKTTDDSGKPGEPIYVLRMLDGVPKDVLKPDAVLACYVVKAGHYKVLGDEKGKKK
jgi:hypothetical protein